MKETKKFILSSLVVSLLLLFLMGISWVRDRRKIVIYQNLSSNVRAKIPFCPPFCPFVGITSNCTCTITLPFGKVNLLFDAFERPGYLCFSTEKNALFIFYWGDTEDFFGVIEPERGDYVTGDIPLQRLELLMEEAEKAESQKEFKYLRAESHRCWSLERVVQSSSDALTVRYMTEDDLRYVHSLLKKQSESEFRGGFQKFYGISRASLVFILESLIKEKEPSWRYFMPEQELRFLEQVYKRENERPGKM